MSESKRHRADVDWQDASPLAQAVFQNEGQTMSMVREALRNGHVRLAYQPVVVAQDTTRIGFHEGLIRVLDPNGRTIPAGSFIGAIEGTELGREIDCAALALGFRTLTEHAGIRLSVNMSARSIGYPKWLRILRHHLGEDAKLGERMILEITETSTMLLPEIVMAFMRQWRGKGLSFAMDDYGSGAISIPKLKEFGFDILKIDGHFTRAIHATPQNQDIAAALLSVAKQFDRMCVAEGVETAADAQWLAALGVDLMQGYAFGAPTINPSWADRKTARSA